MGKPVFRDITRLCNSSSPRFGARVVYYLGHTQEGDGTAESLAAYCSNPAHDASYHYCGDNTTRVAIVDTDEASWSVLNANPRSINYCFAGSRASWTRQQWIDKMRNGIRIFAWTIVEDLAKYPYLRAQVQGRPYPKGDVPCVSDHYFVTRVLGIGTHTDFGPGFPIDLLQADILEYLGLSAPKPSAPVVNRINECAAKNSWLGARVKVGHENKDNEVETPDRRGRFAKFAEGYVYWSPTTGAVAVPNTIFDVWANHGYERGELGYPTVAHTKLDGGIVQAFEKGVIYRQDGAADGFFVHGIIGTRWARMGYEESDLGWPISNEYEERSDGQRRQDFEHDSLVWHPSNAPRVGNVEVVSA